MPTYRQLSDNEFFLLDAALDLYKPDLNDLPMYYAEFRDKIMSALCEYPHGRLLIRDKGGNDRWAVIQSGDIYYAVTDNLQNGVPLPTLRRLGSQFAPWDWGKFIKTWIVGPLLILGFAIWFFFHPPRPIPIMGSVDAIFLSPWSQVAIALMSLAMIFRQMLKPLRYYRRQVDLGRCLLGHFTQKTAEEKRADTERFAGKQPKF